MICTICQETRGNMERIYLIAFFFSLLLSSCTVNITIADTHGYANDLVDETAKTDATADVSVPATAI
jgi:hypothetical protein